MLSQTVSAFNTLFLVLTLFPEVQKRAHAEIDRVVGSERLPEFADEDKLPYITAIIKEILRWAAFVPFGMNLPFSRRLFALSLIRNFYVA